MTGGIVYCLTNSSFKKGIYKIGKTKFINDPYKKRIDLLYKGATGVPTPFKIKLAISTKNIDIAEKKVHSILHHFRVNEKREFFEVDSMDIIKSAFDTIEGTYIDYPERKEDGNRLYIVENILAHTPNKPLNKAKYEIKWLDYDETTWEPYENIKNLRLYKKYIQSVKG
jgi:hypothetical protein